jgi:hypothetical protein
LKIAWSSTALRLACEERDSFDSLPSDVAEDAQLLLSLLATVDDLSELAALRSVTINRGHHGASIVLGLVEIVGEAIAEVIPLQQSGRKIHRSHGLLIHEIRREGWPLWQAERKRGNA